MHIQFYLEFILIQIYISVCLVGVDGEKSKFTMIKNGEFLLMDEN